MRLPPLFLAAAFLAQTQLFSPLMNAGSLPPRAGDAEVARILAAGGCVLQDGTPSYTIAEVARDPGAFVGHHIRIRAVFEQAAEGQYLCADDPSGKPRFGVGYAPRTGEDRKNHEKSLTRIRSRDCIGRALVAVSGMLQHAPQEGFVSYEYRFDVSRFDGVEPVGRPYAGFLEAGECYRTAVTFAPDGTFRLTDPLRLPAHHAARIEWTNLRDLPKLMRAATTPPTQSVVFRVLSKQVAKAGAQERWNTTYRCRIYRID